jgi:hypothetical protein
VSFACVPSSSLGPTYTESDSKIGMWLGCGHLKKLGGSSFFKGSRPEFVPGAASAEGQRGLQKCIIFGERPLQLNLEILAMPGVLKNASFLGWGGSGTQIQWLSDDARADF